VLSTGLALAAATFAGASANTSRHADFTAGSTDTSGWNTTSAADLSLTRKTQGRSKDFPPLFATEGRFMSIWTETTSRYGTAPATVKPVSITTARRWHQERRIKTRRSATMRTAQALVAVR